MNGDEWLAAPDYSDRRNPFCWSARLIARVAQRLLVSAHVDLDPEILRLRLWRGGGVALFYVGLHKSLWETSGLLVPIYEAGLPVPYVGMGGNLIHGRVGGCARSPGRDGSSSYRVTVVPCCAPLAKRFNRITPS